MNLQTFTGASIQAALAEARRHLGDEVVLLESLAAQDGQPARVTVMADAAAAVAQPAGAPEPAPLGFGYAARPMPATPANAAAGAASGSASAPRRSALFAPPADPPPPPPAFDPADLERMLERQLQAQLAPLLEAQLRPLQERLAALERVAGHHLPKAIQRWTTHPFCQELLEAGLEPDTTADLFGALAEQGFRPDERRAEREDELRWALAQELRRRLAPTAPRRGSPGTLLFVGPSGSGKTALLLKLALHPSFFGRRETGVLVLAPEDEREGLYRDPTDLYRRFGLPVQTARTREEVQAALERTQGFDHLLIDTPPLPAGEVNAHRAMLRLRELLADVVPLDVHLVLDARQALTDFDADWMRRLPLPPTAAALTHLDEVAGWGRVAEWLLRLNLPVPFVSTSPRVPDGAHAYTPGWFVEDVARVGKRDDDLLTGRWT